MKFCISIWGCVHKRVKIDRDLLKFIAKIMRLLKKRGSVKVMLKVSYGVCKFTFKKGAKKVKVMSFDFEEMKISDEFKSQEAKN